VVVFHVSLSLASLGGFYLAVTSGIDMVGLLTKIGIGTQYLESGVLTGASTFVIAYAVHKVFAPVRIAITLSVTPFLVRYLRNIGLLKPPKAAVVKPADETESTPGGDSKTDKL
ncbi:protein FAM210B, mitochondrial-like, partial [Lingula anatina]